MVGVNLAGVGDWAIGSSRAGLALATRLAVVEISKASKKSSRGAVSSAAIEVPVSANAMLSPEIRNRYAATGIYHVIRRGTRGRGTATAWAVPAHARPPTRSRKVGLLHF